MIQLPTVGQAAEHLLLLCSLTSLLQQPSDLHLHLGGQRLHPLAQLVQARPQESEETGAKPVRKHLE